MIRGTIFLENIESQEEIYGNANIVLSVSSAKIAHSAKNEASGKAFYSFSATKMPQTLGQQ